MMNFPLKLLIVLIFVANYAFAQNSHTIDSLQKVLKTKVSDQEKVNTYNLIASQYIDSSQVAHYTLQAIRLAESINYDQGIADAWYIAGFARLKRAKTLGTFTFFEKSLKIAQKANYPKGIAKAYNGLGILHGFERHWEKALKFHDQSLKIRRQIGDEKGMAASYNNIGIIYMRQNNDTKALEFYKKSLQSEITIGNKKGIGDTYSNLGNIYQRQGNYLKALDLYTKAIKIQQALQDKPTLMNSYNNLGTVYSDQGDFLKSVEFLQKAISIAGQLGLERTLGTLYSNLGAEYTFLGKYTQALKACLASLKIREKRNDQLGMAQVFTNIGNIYQSQGNYSKSLDYSLRALQKYQQLKDKRRIALGYQNLGMTYEIQGNYSKALTYQQKSLELRSQINDRVALVDNYLGLGRIASYQQKPKQALAWFNKALKEYARMNRKAKSANTYINLGIAYLSQKNYPQAQKHLEKGMKMARQTNLALYLKEGAKYLSKVYQAIGQPQKALENHILFKQMADSLLNKATIQKITRLETQYAAQKREDSLQHVQARKDQLMQADIRQRESTQRATYMALGLSALLVVVLWLFYRVQQRTNGKLNQALQKLKALDQFKEKMVGMIVHDLKNPLQAIIGFSTRQANEASLSTIRQAAQRMHLLILNMLDTQKYTQTTVPLKTSAQSLNQLGKNAIEQVRWFAQAKNIQLEQIATQEMRLLLDEQLMSRVFLNLLHNAIKFTPQNGHITLKYEVLAATQAVKVMVIDNGEGIDFAQQQVIFEPYHQANAHQGSTGLGLSFCKMVIKAHQGNIGVDACPGKGSTFWFTLPMAQEAFVEQLLTNQPQASVAVADTASHLNEKDKAYLMPYLSKIKEYKFYEFSRIEEVLNQLDTNKHPQLEPWKDALKEAVITSNQSRYEALTNV